MGDVAIKIKITPESPEIDMEEVKERLSKVLKIEDSKLEDVGFGVKDLKILVIRPDKEGGGTDDIEESIRKVEGVGDVIVEDVSLL